MAWIPPLSLKPTKLSLLKQEDGEYNPCSATSSHVVFPRVCHFTVALFHHAAANRYCFSSSTRFLLKYVSRDEVAVLGQGTGGVPEIRSIIDTYEDKSPLYGFLQYRRRKVILKYMPEGMSRLLQGTFLLY